MARIGTSVRSSLMIGGWSKAMEDPFSMTVIVFSISAPKRA